MLSKNEEAFLKQVESLLQKPKWKFILVYGMSWTIVVMSINLLLQFFVFEKGSFTVLRLVKGIIIWLLAGIGYGLWLRAYLCKRHNAIKNKLKESGS